jgi:hypothetical protein
MVQIGNGNGNQYNLLKQTRDGSFKKGFFDDRLVFFFQKYLLVEIRNDQIHDGTKNLF